MKPLFVCLVFSFLLTVSVNSTAQNAQQVGATAAKTTVKPATTAETPPQATPAVASKPTPAKAKKSAKSSDKAKSKGLFDNDFDGEVGIKYIGTEPLPDEEIGRVKDSKRTDAPAKRHHKAATKPATKKVSEAKTEVQEVKPEAVKSTPTATTAKITEVKTVKPEVIKPATAAVVAPKPTPVKVVKMANTTPKAAEIVKKAEVKVEPMEAKADVKISNPVVRAPETPKVEVVKTEAAPVVRATAKSITKSSKPVVRGARMEVENMTIELGNVKEDAVLERYYEFTNTGGSNLEILECRGSCGCVQPKAMSTIIAPGEHGQIYVKYTARNKVGPQKPVVTVTTNGTPAVLRLFVEAWVEQIPGGVKDTTPASTPKKEDN